MILPHCVAWRLFVSNVVNLFAVVAKKTNTPVKTRVFDVNHPKELFTKSLCCAPSPSSYAVCWTIQTSKQPQALNLSPFLGSFFSRWLADL